MIKEYTQSRVEDPGRAALAADARHAAGLEFHDTDIRPLSLADRDAYRAFAARLHPNDVRLRFAGPTRLTDQLCVRFLAIDHVREEAFGAFDLDGDLLGVGRVVRISDEEGDIALIVRSDRKRRGLGMALMNRIISHARSIGLKALRGDVLHENLPMRGLAKRAGFRFVGVGLMTEIRLELGPETSWLRFETAESLAH